VLKNILFFLTSFLITSLGQPAVVPILGPMAALGGYAFFWISIHDLKSPFYKFLASFIWFFFIQLVQSSWLVSLKYQGFYILIVYFFLAALLGLQFSVVSSYVLGRRDSPCKLAFSAAAIGALLEWSRLFIFSGFPFNFSGISLACFIPSMQLASVFGVIGLSFFVWLANTLLYFSFRRHQDRWKCIALFLVVALTPYCFGWFMVIEKDESHPRELVRVLLVQTAISPSQKNQIDGFYSDFISPYKQWSNIITYLKPNVDKGIDIVILPESSVCFGVNKYCYKLEDVFFVLEKNGLKISKFFPPLEEPYAACVEGQWRVSNGFWFQCLANYMGCEFIVGLDREDQKLKKYYNSALLFTPFSKGYYCYDKKILLPIAEGAPDWKPLQSLAKIYGVEEFFTPGTRSNLIGKKRKMGVAICIEELFPEHMKRFKNLGADFLVALTNDAWYPKSILPAQHFTHARLRAVECGLTLVRCSNNGFSCVVDPLGRFVNRLKPENRYENAESGAIIEEFFSGRKKTVYTILGDGGIVSFCLLVLVLSSVSTDRLQGAEIDVRE